MNTLLILLIMSARALALSTAPSNDVQAISLADLDIYPCQVTKTENDVKVDCANKNLDHLKAEWFPLNTTYLNIEGNLLDSIPVGIFENCSQLQTLNLNNNKIKTIMSRAFLGLSKLENLYLEKNKLDICDDRFPVSAFERLENLKVLDLIQYLPFDKDKYCYGFIGNIVGLTSLSIDTRGKHVYFGEEFQNLTNLEKLIITGNAEIITDDSFKHLSNLRYLDLSWLANMRNVSINFLVPLVKLDQLFMTYITIGTEYALSLLHPFLGRNMTTIQLRRVCLPSPWLESENNFKDGVLDANKTATLRRICVADFALTLSYLYYLGIGALTSETWDRCLRNLDLSINLWQGNEKAFVMLLRLKNLRSVSLAGALKNRFYTIFPMVIDIPPFKYSSFFDRSFPGIAEKETWRNGLWGGEYSGKVFSRKNNESLLLHKVLNLNINRNGALKVEFHNYSSDSESIIFWMSGTLTFIDVRRLTQFSYMNRNVIIMNAENVEFLDISDNGLNTFTGKFEGLTGLKTVIVSGNDMSTVSPTLFDTFPAIETLAVANCGFDVNFIATQGTRFLSNLKRLKVLDLSSNSLNILASDMFRPNTDLTELGISGNRFSEIPFRLTDTPKLMRLDIRYNALATIKQQITGELDSLAQKWGKFELFLDGNILSCACQNVKFLQWLRLTSVTLDLGGNFTCINEQGAFTYTYAYTDLEGFWRQCSGQFFFYISLILFCVIAIGFLCAFVITKYRTFFISQLWSIFFGFRQHMPGDYRRGVFLAYEDKDYPFVTGDLLRFIEKRLGMTTYIRDRDLELGVILGEAIAEAIASCWRSVILINQDFQDSSEYFQFTCRSAVSMINLANPFRVLVIVTERYRHRIPREILSAIQEDNIVVVERLTVDDALQQILRNRLQR